MTTNRARRGVAVAAAATLVGLALTGCGRWAEAAKPRPLPSATAATGRVSGVLVASERNDAILVLDPRTLRTRTVLSLDATSPGPRMPHELAVTPDHRTLLVTEYGFGALGVLDLDRRRLVAEIPVGRAPHGLALSPDGRFAYVVASNDNWLAVVDLKARKLVAQIPTPLLPWDVVLSKDGSTAWVTSLGDSKLVRVDLVKRKVMRTADLGEPFVVAAAMGGDRRLVVGGHSSNRLFVVDARTGSVLARPSLGGPMPALVPDGDTVSYFCTFRPGSGAMPVAMSPAGSDRLLVVNHGTDDLAVLRLPSLTVQARIPVGSDPQAVVASPDGRFAYVAAGGAGELWRIDLSTRAVTARAATGARPMGVLFLGDQP